MDLAKTGNAGGQNCVKVFQGQEGSMNILRPGPLQVLPRIGAATSSRF